MATYTAAKLYGSASVVAGPTGSGDVKLMICQASVSAALAQNDIIQSPEFPDDTIIVDVAVHSTDMDTNGTPTATFHVGYGGDTDYFIVSSTIPQTGGFARAAAATFVPLQFDGADRVDVLAAAAVATGATGTVTMWIWYLPPNGA